MRFSFLTGTLREHQGQRRPKLIEKFKRGKIDILLATGILDEGFDAPNVRFLILAGGGKAEHRQHQRIGRGRRASEGKDTLYVVDFRDRGHYLGKHSEARLAAYKAQPAFTVTELTVAELEEMFAA